MICTDYKKHGVKEQLVAICSTMAFVDDISVEESTLKALIDERERKRM